MKRIILLALLAAFFMLACKRNTVIDNDYTKSDIVAVTDVKMEETIIEDKAKAVDINKDNTEINQVDVVFSNSAEKMANEILEKEKQEFYSHEHEYEMDVAIYDKAVINTLNGELYFFCISTMPLGDGDSIYIIKDTGGGARVIYSDFISSRSHCNIYDGGYIQSSGNGGATCLSESMYRVDSDMELLYTYKIDDLKSYFYSEYKRDFGAECNLLETLEKANISDYYIDCTVIIMFYAGGNWVWEIEFPDREADKYRDLAIEVIELSNISEAINICYDKESFVSKREEMIENNGIDLDSIYKNDPIIGEKESLFFYEDKFLK